MIFRSILETYALVIPYYKLNLYKGKAEKYSIYPDHYFIKIKENIPRVHKFMKKVATYKAQYWSSSSQLLNHTITASFLF